MLNCTLDSHLFFCLLLFLICLILPYLILFATLSFFKSFWVSICLFTKFLKGTFGFNKYMATYIVEEHLVRINMTVIICAEVCICETLVLLISPFNIVLKSNSINYWFLKWKNFTTNDCHLPNKCVLLFALCFCPRTVSFTDICVPQ